MFGPQFTHHSTVPSIFRHSRSVYSWVTTPFTVGPFLGKLCDISLWLSYFNSISSSPSPSTSAQQASLGT